MAINHSSQGGIIIFLSVIAATALTLVPFPDIVRLLRPEWVLLTLIYWAMALPQRLGVANAWLTGLLMDLILGGPLGVIAFAYAFAIYFVHVFHLQLRQYPLWQQAVNIFVLVFVLQVMLVLTSIRTAEWTMILPSVTSMLLWPVAYNVLRGVRRSFDVK
ncbi:MAG: rod shape-determining protein MreD [Gammaproteobacteria bacterium]|nr:MAG: rod shape-determining protein MreD [Gammaproteobacteria bacterium]